MRKATIIVFLSTLVLVVPMATAAPDQTSNGDNNGKPFKELSEEIQRNRALIEANTASVASLRADVDAAFERLGGIDDAMSALDERVVSNQADIQEALELIGDALVATDAAAADIASLQEDLATMAAQQAEDQAAMEAEIARIDGELAAMAQQTAALAGELAAKVAELRTAILGNEVGIDALLVDITLLNAEVGTLSAQYAALGNRQDSLQGQVDTLGSSLSGLQAGLNALGDRVDTYHFDPCLEALTIGMSLIGNLSSGDGCTSDYGPPRAARYYTFTVPTTRTVRIEMRGSSTGYGSLYDPFLVLRQGGRGGAILRADNNNGSGRDAYIVMTLGPGTYTIEATSYSVGQYGSYRIILY